jgi:hypothetical protein
VAKDFTAEAEKLNEDFVRYMRTQRPLVTKNGAHADGNRRPTTIPDGLPATSLARMYNCCGTLRRQSHRCG